MDNTWEEIPDDSKREVGIYWHPSATPLEMVTEAYTDAVDISTYVTKASHGPSEGSVSVTWHMELYEINQPQPGHIIEFRLSNKLLWWGVIEAITDYRLSSGNKSLTLTLRSRDSTTHWRSTRQVTDIYPVATPLSVIAYDVATNMGLTNEEIMFGETSVTTVHTNTQLADLTAWEMLEKLGEPLGAQPFINARGVLKVISRDTLRDADIQLTTERIISVTAAKSRPPLTAVRVLWLDPGLTKVSQQDQRLASATITAGFFQLKQKKRIHFSEDGTQRADNTHLVITQSANSGVLAAIAKVCDEDYDQISTTEGKITLTTKAWVPGLVGVEIAGLIASSYIGDGVPTAPGETVPVGRVVEAISTVGILTTMASIGTGMYEVWGTPYDFVHTRNRTEAYNDLAQEWMTNEVEIENDFVMDEPMAQAYAIRELLYRSRASSSFNVSIVDDPRIEPGDILELPDESRLYVTNYRRDISSGSSAVLDVEGFRI